MTTFTGTIPTIAAGDTTTVPTNLATYRDALKATSEAWTSYGSGASWTSSGTAPALGNGTWNAAYCQIGKLVHFRIQITMGSTTTFGTGAYRLALPVAPKAGIRWSFWGEAQDTGTANYSLRGSYDSTAGVGTVIGVSRIGGGAAADSSVTNTAPHTWANTDILTMAGTFEAA